MYDAMPRCETLRCWGSTSWQGFSGRKKCGQDVREGCWIHSALRKAYDEGTGVVYVAFDILFGSDFTQCRVLIAWVFITQNVSGGSIWRREALSIPG
jgi:hypothetical protein